MYMRNIVVNRQHNFFRCLNIYEYPFSLHFMFILLYCLGKRVMALLLWCMLAKSGNSHSTVAFSHVLIMICWFIGRCAGAYVVWYGISWGLWVKNGLVSEFYLWAMMKRLYNIYIVIIKLTNKTRRENNVNLKFNGTATTAVEMN